MAKQKKWEMLLAEAKFLMQQSRDTLFDVVSKMVSVSNDADFLAFHGGVIDKADEHLDQFLADYDITFREAELVLKYYPAREQWRNTGIRVMLAESIVRRDEASKSGAPTRNSPRRVTIAEYEKLQEQLDTECKHTSAVVGELSEARSEMKTLREENRRLMRELAVAEGRISELERMIKREPAMV